jgi:hypothetical protein
LKQIVSLIKDNQAHLALVDEDDGSMIPFLDLLVPDPDRFGLQEVAILGTEVIKLIGLNGSKRPKLHIPRVGDELPAATETRALEAPTPPVKAETARERRNRIARESYQARGGRSPKPKPNTKANNNAQRYVSLDEVMEVVNQYPEGIRVRDLAERLWRNTDGQGSDEPHPAWFYTSVSNRLTAARARARNAGIPLPFREEDRPVPSKDGEYRGDRGKFLLPLAPAPTAPAVAGTPLPYS